MDEKIVIENVCKSYGKKQALKNVSLTINKGMFGLLGRNGAGKTTLMKALVPLHGINGGSISVCGIPIERAREVRSITGYLPQDFAMYPNMTAYECLDYLGNLSGMDKKLRRERIDTLLKKVNLSDKRNAKFKSLSGGMKRRLGIAQALLHSPRTLIVDEPTAGLDPEERIRFRNLLCEIAEERIVILSTHIVGDIEAACENIAVFNEGEVLWQGTVTGLISEAEGKVYAVNVKRDHLAAVKKNFIVTSMLSQGEYSSVKIVSEKEPDISGAVFAEPNAEDAYMYCLYKNGCGTVGGEL